MKRTINEKSTMTCVYSGLPIDCYMIRSLLNDYGIEVYLQDECMGTIAPWYASPGGVGAVRLMVANDDADDAWKVVDEYENNIH